jgi:hypothetical protein
MKLLKLLIHHGQFRFGLCPSRSEPRPVISLFCSCSESAFLLVRIRAVWYWKQYMRKNRYRYKRYMVYLPKAIGDLLDTKIEYVVQLFGPAVVLLPKGLESFLSRLENLEKANRGNTAQQARVSTDSLLEDSRIRQGEE